MGAKINHKTMNVIGLGVAITFTVVALVYEVNYLGYSVSQQGLVIGVFIWGVMAVFDYVQMKIPMMRPNPEHIRRWSSPIGSAFALALFGIMILLLALMGVAAGISVVVFGDPWHVAVSVVAVLVLVRVSVTLGRDSIKAVRNLTKRKEYA